MKKGIIILILFLVIIPTRAWSQAPEERFAEANDLYQSGDYSGAAAIYQKLYNEGFRSEVLLYNAGNAFYKSGDNAAAILFYERARLLSPADEDIDYNLQIARSKVSDKFDEIPRVFFVRWFDFLSLLLSTNSWAVITLVLFVVFLISGAFFLTRPGGRGKALSFWVSVFALILASVTLTMSVRNNDLINHNKKAVVMCSILTGTSEPGGSGNELFVIHSGTTVVVEDTLGDYSEIRLPDGNKGWVKGDCIERI